MTLDDHDLLIYKFEFCLSEFRGPISQIWETTTAGADPENEFGGANILSKSHLF